MPKKRNRTRKPYRPSSDPRVIALRERRANANERAKQRQWGLDKSTGHKAPDYYDYPEVRDNDETPVGRTERRFLDKFEG